MWEYPQHNLSFPTHNLPVDSVHVNSLGPESQRYYLQAINYNNYTIRLVDPDIQKDDFCSIPSNSLCHLDSWPNSIYETVIFFTCDSPVLNSSYIDASPCIFNVLFHRNVPVPIQLKAIPLLVLRLPWSLCWIEQTSLITKGHSNKKLTSNDIHNLLVYGFELSWMQSFATRHQSSCYVDGEESNSVPCINYCIFPDYRVDDMDRYGKDIPKYYY